MVIFFVIGLLIVGLGIYTLIKDIKGGKAGLVKAVVHNCAQSYMNNTEEDNYDVTLELQMPYGITYKTIQSKKQYNIGEIMEVYYNQQKDEVELAKEVRGKKKNNGVAIIIFGLIWCGIIGMAQYATTSEEGGEAVAKIFLLIMGLVFAYAGANMCIVKPMKRKKAMVDCQIVQGTQVDYKTKHDSDGDRLYQPIYSYYYNGEERRLSATVSSNSSKSRQVGRPVTIIINNKTGEVYCKEDVSSARGMGILFFLVGIGMVALFAYLVMANSDMLSSGKEPDRGTSTNNGNGLADNNSSYELELNKNGYSNKFLKISDNEVYSEYYYMPEGEAGVYSYNIKIYHAGIGELTLFPNVSSGKAFNQCFSFYVDEAKIDMVVQDSETYQFKDLAGEVREDKDSEWAELYEALYYYDGSERDGSFGTGIAASLFDSVAGHIKDCVPQVVWDAVKEEMRNYYD